MLSGLAVIVAAGDIIRLYRQRISALVWLGLLVVPPAVIVAATVTLPWTAAVDLEVSKPANAMGQFFTETFRRRTGKPLAIVIGDVRTAGLVAFASPDRPSLYVDGVPQRAPWLSDEAVREKGAIIAWMATDAAGTPPPALKARFPDLCREVPRSFDRSVQGRLPTAAHRLGDDPAEDRRRAHSMIPFAFLHLAAEQVIDEARIDQDDRQQRQRADQHEDLARRRGGGIPDRDRGRHEIGRIPRSRAPDSRA